MQQKQRNRTSIEIIMISSDCTDLQRQCTHSHTCRHICATRVITQPTDPLATPVWPNYYTTMATMASG